MRMFSPLSLSTSLAACLLLGMASPSAQAQTRYSATPNTSSVKID
jgi:hypothetical protein